MLNKIFSKPQFFLDIIADFQCEVVIIQSTPFDSSLYFIMTYALYRFLFLVLSINFLAHFSGIPYVTL